MCSNKLDDVIRTIVEVGGGYDEIAECLLEAKRKEYLETRVVVDALPRVNRALRRSEDSQPDAEAAGDDAQKVASPMPDLFRNRLSGEGADDDWNEGGEAGRQEPDVDAEKKDPEGLWEKWKEWF